MHINLLGTRGSLPTPGPDFIRYGGNTSCVTISRAGELPSLILDAGTGMANAGRIMGTASFQGSVLLGHLHWDHIYGLPFFRPGDSEDSRVDVYVPEQPDPAAQLDRVMSPPIFPVDIGKLRGSWRINSLSPGAHQIEGFDVLALEIPHKGGRAFGYRIEDETGSLAYLSDHSPISLGPGSSGIGELHDAAMQLAQDVDLLIHDSQYTPEEFAARYDWGHCSYEYPLELADASGAKRTLLFHHDPSHTDDVLDALAATLSNSTATFAVEGTRIQIGEG
ncbi:MAG: MBL fold metallo-hydrolase [Acidimicrobiia bacterium]|nr:MBL fold metallo-hydrolase [Acidimicrobiia bacterium]MDX2468115.1 MBL fold metallo-hydrolase [Acidimicrobiia bacterium]